MIKQITWTEFWSFMIATLFIYYAIVIIRFYSTEIKTFVTEKIIKKKKLPDN